MIGVFGRVAFTVTMLLATVYSSTVWAGLKNSGVYIANPTVKAGETVSISSSILADAIHKNVTVTIGIHSISAAGAIASSPVFYQAFAAQNFVAGTKLGYKVAYKVPSTLISGKYALVIKAGTAVHNSSLLLAQGTVAPFLMQLTGTAATPVTPPTNSGAVTNYLRNSGIYIANSAPKAGSTIKISNSILAARAVSGITLSFEIRAISASGVVASSAIVKKTVTGLSFAANERKAYGFDYLIPSTAVSGKYIFAIYATDSKAVTHLKVDSSLGANDLQIAGTATPAPTQFLRGINIMDLGIAKEVVPGVYGTNYTKPSLHALRSLKDRGMQVVRIPFKWERIQYVWGGPLESAYLGYLMQVLRDANSVGLKVIVDMHNYARYRRNGVEILFSDANGPTQAQYADVWKKIVNAIRADANAYNAVWAYDIMNEPHNLKAAKGYATPQKLWEGYAQAAVSGIRATGEKKLIHVEGYSFSSAADWAKNHAAPFVKDPLNNIMYHAHMYMDWNTAGVYNTKSHAEETALAKSQGHASVGARGIARLKVFANWCAQFKQQCFLGEFGWPTAGVVGASEARLWNREGEELMTYMDQIGMGGTMWATGSWLSNSGNVMVTYVLPKAGQTITPLSQAEVLERHLGK